MRVATLHHSRPPDVAQNVTLHVNQACQVSANANSPIADRKKFI